MVCPFEDVRHKMVGVLDWRPSSGIAVIFQGGLFDHISCVPGPIPASPAKSESNCYLAACTHI